MHKLNNHMASLPLHPHGNLPRTYHNALQSYYACNQGKFRKQDRRHQRDHCTDMEYSSRQKVRKASDSNQERILHKTSLDNLEDIDTVLLKWHDPLVLYTRCILQ